MEGLGANRLRGARLVSGAAAIGAKRLESETTSSFAAASGRCEVEFGIQAIRMWEPSFPRNLVSCWEETISQTPS